MQQGKLRRAKLSPLAPIIFAFGLVLLVAMLVIVGWTLADARGAARRQAEAATSNITLTLERDLGATIKALDMSLRAAIHGMGTPGLDEMQPDIRNAILFNGAAESNVAEDVFMTNAAGRVIYDLHLGAQRPNLNERAFFKAHRDHPDLGLLISNPQQLGETPKWVICLTRRINHPDGSFAGVALVGLPIDYILSLFHGLQLGDSGAISFFNMQGRLLARWPSAEQDIGRDLSGDSIFNHLVKSPSGNFEAKAPIDGVTRLYSYRQIANFPLIVGAGLAKQDVFAEWNKKTAIIVAILVSLCLLGITLACFLRRELLRRVEAEETANRAAATAEALTQDLARAVAPINTLFNNSVDTMQVIYKNIDGEFVYEAVNPTWLNIVGLPKDVAIGRTPKACLPPKAAETILAMWLECSQKRHPVRRSLEYPPQSERHWDIVVLPIVSDDDSVARLLVVGRDVTERNRLAAAELQQAQKIEVMGQLAAGMSHDFNNILQVIAGSTEIISDETALSAEATTLLDMIQKATRRGASLTRHLLDYSRKQVWNPELLNLADIFENLRVILSRTLGTHISVAIDIAPAIGLIRADRSQLETAVMNLAINASHAMPEGGTLRFEVARAAAAPAGEGPKESLGDNAGRSNVLIAVADNGTGIPPDVLGHIFEPFFSTKGAAGNGLGLAMVQRFARQSGGDVRVTSVLGEGTRFEICLPEFQEPAPQIGADSALESVAHEGSVLLIDDAEDVRIIVAAFLRAGGFTVHQASSGQQALWAIVAGTRFDLVITDQVMANMKGAELIRRVRQLQPDLPALIITGFPDTIESLTDIQGVGALIKPFQRSELIETVSRLIARGRNPSATPTNPGHHPNGALERHIT